MSQLEELNLRVALMGSFSSEKIDEYIKKIKAYDKANEILDSYIKERKKLK